jgi:hypothetical protein
VDFPVGELAGLNQFPGAMAVQDHALGQRFEAAKPVACTTPEA